MAKQIEGVYENIIACATKEFLNKGYADASLRTIATEAHTTTGSIYTRFGDKEGLLYCYDNLDVFKLILLKSEGTKFSHMIDEMVKIEADATHKYLNVLKRLGKPSPKIDTKLEHMIITGMFNTYFELIIHEMPIEDAKLYLKEMREFYTAGWMKIMGQD